MKTEPFKIEVNRSFIEWLRLYTYKKLHFPFYFPEPETITFTFFVSPPVKKKVQRAGIIFRLASFWVGFHYSKYCGRLCINLLPCITIWFGNKPEHYYNKK